MPEQAARTEGPCARPPVPAMGLSAGTQPPSLPRTQGHISHRPAWTGFSASGPLCQVARCEAEALQLLREAL